MVNNILEALINVSEKAANIARVFRQNEHLFSLLVQEKSAEESNPRFVHDYKTLADVLIQETIRYDIGISVSISSILHLNRKKCTIFRTQIYVCLEISINYFCLCYFS